MERYHNNLIAGKRQEIQWSISKTTWIYIGIWKTAIDRKCFPSFNLDKNKLLQIKMTIFSTL